MWDKNGHLGMINGETVPEKIVDNIIELSPYFQEIGGHICFFVIVYSRFFHGHIFLPASPKELVRRVQGK